MKKFLLLLLSMSLTSTLLASDGKTIAKKYGISASSKASSQWQRKFEKNRKPFKEISNDEEKKALLEYLKSHAADSNTPEAAGM